MKKILTMFLIISVCLIFCGCEKNDKIDDPIINNNSDKIEVPNGENKKPEMQKYVIQLTKDNYKDYFDIEYGERSVAFKGALKYAIYDECIITYMYNTYASYGPGYAIAKFKLNKAGNGIEVATGSITITNFEGTVTYWM